MIFVDTNYFLRLLLKDVDDQHKKAKKVFQQAAKGEKQIFTSTIVFFEIYWVLTSFYEKNKNEVVSVLNKILAMKFVELKEREMLLGALKLFENESIDLEDAYNLVYAQSNNASKFNTFDKKLKNLF